MSCSLAKPGRRSSLPFDDEEVLRRAIGTPPQPPPFTELASSASRRKHIYLLAGSVTVLLLAVATVWIAQVDSPSPPDRATRPVAEPSASPRDTRCSGGGMVQSHDFGPKAFPSPEDVLEDALRSRHSRFTVDDFSVASQSSSEIRYEVVRDNRTEASAVILRDGRGWYLEVIAICA